MLVLIMTFTIALALINQIIVTRQLIQTLCGSSGWFHALHTLFFVFHGAVNKCRQILVVAFFF